MNRQPISAVALFTAAALIGAYVPGQQPGREEEVIPGPQQQAKLAIAHLIGEVSAADRVYTRYLSFWAAPPAQRDRYRRLASWWLHQMTMEKAVNVPRAVGGSGGMLYAIDLRDYGWSAEAWRAVASRDPSTRQPGVTRDVAESLRGMIGEEAISRSAEAAKSDSLPLVGVVNGYWLVRETMESGRSPSYYDLLFSRQRHGAGRQAAAPKKVKRTAVIHHWGGDYPHPDGRVRENMPAGRYSIEWYEDEKDDKGKQVVSSDFPKDEDDWDKAFGLDRIKGFGREEKIDLDFGAIVAGNRDDPQQGSIVALNNRLVVVLPTPYGRVAMKTFDVKETSGDKDYSETLIFAGGRFKRGDGARAINDGGELLAYLPNGGLAGLLINGERKRVEVADSAVANDSVDKRLNAGVRNPGSCHICHGPSGGFIPPRDVITEGLRAGIDAKFKDREQRNRLRGFFEGWEEDIAGYQRPYETLVARTTLDPADQLGARPWTGQDVAKGLGDLRHGYDDPITAETAAREMGLPVDGLKWLAVRSLRNRAQQLVRGFKIPRTSWDKDVMPELMLRLDASRGDPGFAKYCPK